MMHLRTTAFSAAVLAAAGLVFAAAGTVGAAASGQGQIRAKGEGIVHCRASGHVAFTLYGQGRLIVRNRLSVTLSTVGDKPPKLSGPTAVYQAYKGTVKVTGAKIDCRFEGGQVAFAGRGKGTVFLKGTGRYWAQKEGPLPWKPGGQTLTLAPKADDQEAEDDGDESAYYQECQAALDDLAESEAYKAWAKTHPAAAKYLAEHPDWLALLKAHGDAAEKLFTHPKFPVWAKAHPEAAKFLTVVRDYHAWRKGQPVLAPYLHNPLAWHRWLESHPDAAKAVKAQTYREWKAFVEAHPAAAAALRKHDLAVKKRLDVNNDGRVDATERREAWKRRADRNRDGTVDPAERKAARERHRRWFRRADRNRDGRIDPAERARDLRKRPKRRPPPP